MWKEHDEIRQYRKELFELINSAPSKSVDRLKELSILISELFSNHIYKEHKVLFPSAQKLIDENEWKEMRRDFDEIGYFIFEPMPMEFQFEDEEEVKNGLVNLGSGVLTMQQLKMVLNNLPVDITFVDSEDTVRYFIETRDRIFVRARGIVGRKVQNCHPEKSVDIVNGILEDFKSGKRDIADFWIPMGEMLIYIRYFALRDKTGKYLGALEITQDIAPLKRVEGEKRIYDGS